MTLTSGLKPRTSASTRRLAGHWRLLLTPPLHGVDNMAVDEALLARARRSGERVVRVYGWSQPTLSLGRNQRAVGVYDPVRAAELGVAIVRRPTGGRALLHHREITYSVTSPSIDGRSLRDVYEAINEILLSALRGLGVHATLATPRGRTPLPASAPCFEQPAAGEIVIGDRKLVGSAQMSEDGALLQHGSILLDDDQPMIAQLAAVPVAEVAPAATLRDAMGTVPDLAVAATSLFDAVRDLEDSLAEPLRLEEIASSDVHRARERYASDAWTWRR